jgi:uncharacterized protein GlcG (DUF336 family)
MMLKTAARWTITAAFALFSFAAMAQQMPNPYGPPITLDQARKAAAAAAAEANKNNWKMAIAVVDPAGNLVFFEKLDGTQTASVKIALDKARSSAQFKRPTKTFQDAMAKGQEFNYILGLDGAVPVEGGIPLLINNQIVGAIGASGGTGQQDGVVSQAGVNALK